MSPFGMDILALPATLIFMIVFAATLLFTKDVAAAVLCALVKAGLYVVYFGVYFDGSFTADDDWTYLDRSQAMLHHGVGLFNLPEMWGFVLSTSGGDHVVYYLHNALAQSWFGEGYYAPVGLNVMLTAAVAYFGAGLARAEFGMGLQASRLFYVFLLLHPDVLTWSTVMNGKDVMVLLLHVLLLTAVAMFLRGRVSRAVALGAPVTLTLLFLRFYVPLLIAMALAAGVGFKQRRGRLKLLAVAMLLVAGGVAWIGPEKLLAIQASVASNFVNPVFGFARALLTPIPFNVDAGNEYLNAAALIHWILLPFALLGAWCVYKMQTPFTRVFVFYVLFFVGLYAVYGELQGPRHRVQLDFALAVLQFVGLAAAWKLTFRPFQPALRAVET